MINLSDDKGKEFMELKLIKNVPLFSGLKESELKRIAGKMIRDHYPKGTIIFLESDEGDSLFIIQNGRVKISRISEDGGEVILAILKDGDFFGEMSILDGQLRSANVMAIEDSDILALRREEFMKLLIHHPEISIQLLKELAHRIRQSDSQIKSLSLLDASSRVAAAIVQLAEETGVISKKSVKVSYLPSQQDLANIAGTSRETISRTLNQFIKEGLISREKNDIIIEDINEFKRKYL